MMILRHPKTGEQVVTASRAGYPGWRLVEDNVARPRGHCIRKKGRWHCDRTRKREPTMEELAAKIEELQARLDAR